MGGTFPEGDNFPQLGDELWALPAHLHLGVGDPRGCGNTLTVREGRDVKPRHKEGPLIPGGKLLRDQDESSAAALIAEAPVR